MIRAFYFAFATALVLTQIRASDALSTIEGRVVGVHDGDTITLLTVDKAQVKILLEGIDAPALKQDFGNLARQELIKPFLAKWYPFRITG